MNTVWLLDKGEYSERTVIGIYTSEALALKVKRLYEEANDPIEIELDAGVDLAESGKKCYTAYLGLDLSYTVAQSDPYIKPDDLKLSMNYDGAYYTFWAKDDEHAHKIAQDKVIEFIDGMNFYGKPIHLNEIPVGSKFRIVEPYKVSDIYIFKDFNQYQAVYTNSNNEHYFTGLRTLVIKVE